MDSSILQLKEALDQIVDLKCDGVYIGTGTGFARAGEYIGGTFSGVNDTLSSGWYTTRDFCYKIFESVHAIASELHEQVNLYTDETYQAELGAKAAVEAANDAAQSILADLGL